jgi:hypothetical protein
MNPFFSALLVCACLISFHVPLAGAVETDVDMEDLTRAKVAKARAKQSAFDSSKGNASDAGGSNGCGNVDIGNFTNTRPGKAPKEIIVVVQGDVINSGNRCK